jgi:hypothetical protein
MMLLMMGRLIVRRRCCRYRRIIVIVVVDSNCRQVFAMVLDLLVGVLRRTARPESECEEEKQFEPGEFHARCPKPGGYHWQWADFK